MRLAAATNVVITDPCAYPGDLVTFTATFQVVLGAQARHDVGIYFATDGDPNSDGALTGECSVSSVPYAPDLPWLDLDGTDDPLPGTKTPASQQDVCGDIDGTHNPLYPTITITTTCSDPDGDGYLNLPYCTSWRQSGSNEYYAGPLSAFPGAPSKCKCDPGFEVPVPVPPAELVVTKTASAEIIDEPGANVTFAVSVKNVGSDPSNDVTLESLTDDIYGDIADGANPLIVSTTCSVPQTIPPGEAAKYQCSFTAWVGGHADDSQTDTVTASGHDERDNELSGNDDATVTLRDVLPEVDLVKDVTPAALEEPGGEFYFTLTIYNTSVEPVQVTDLSDDNPLPTACTDLIDEWIPVDGSLSCSYSVTHTDAGTYPNTASVTVQDNEGNEASATDPEAVTVIDVLPTVDLTKTADPLSLPEPGGVFNFSLSILNPSVEDVTITALTDDNPLSTECLALIGTSIPAGGTVSCSYTTSHTEAGVYPNTAEVSVQDNEGNPASDSDSEEVTVTNVLPMVDLNKTAEPLSLPEPGGIFGFSLLIHNPSVEAVTITTLTDSNPLSAECMALIGTNLPPGETVSCGYPTYHDNAGIYPNTASVTVQDNEGNEASATDSEEVRVLDESPLAHLTKTPAWVVVTFEVVVTNDGVSTDPLTLNSLIDDVYGDIADAENELIVGTDCAVPQVIAWGGSYACRFTAVVAEPQTDTVTAGLVDDEGSPVEPSPYDSAWVDFEVVVGQASGLPPWMPY